MRNLILLGLNHATAPLELRERLAFSSDQQARALRAFKARFAQHEALLLSTCNRVELYAAAESSAPDSSELIDFLCDFHSVPRASFEQALYRRQDREAMAHLFSVAASLDSMVLGETQILGQVRQSYDAARSAQTIGPILHPLLQRAIAVGKEVLGSTSLAEGRLSVASVAVDHAKRIFETFADKQVLSIGGGKMAALVLQHFAALRPGRLMICNRELRKAEMLAARFAGDAVPFLGLIDHLVAADVVISSTGSTQPIISRLNIEAVLKQRRYKPMFLIDIAVPRDIEASVSELDHAYLYNIDDLQHAVSATQAQRTGAIEKARAIVARHVDEYLEWHRQRSLGPTIDQVYRRSHELARAELERTLGKLPALALADKEQLEELTRRIVNKLLHDPIAALRNGQGNGQADGEPARVEEDQFDVDESAVIPDETRQT
ncbi:MAG: glutamyl-tRNA reductase [Anaerolineae bacterium]|nr:glutamyl-tRNA reductase [Phycisphaerae bacterium]